MELKNKLQGGEKNEESEVMADSISTFVVFAFAGLIIGNVIAGNNGAVIGLAIGLIVGWKLSQ